MSTLTRTDFYRALLPLFVFLFALFSGAIQRMLSKMGTVFDEFGAARGADCDSNVQSCLQRNSVLQGCGVAVGDLLQGRQPDH
jgi:hypothetical protein